MAFQGLNTILKFVNVVHESLYDSQVHSCDVLVIAASASHAIFKLSN